MLVKLIGFGILVLNFFMQSKMFILTHNNCLACLRSTLWLNGDAFLTIFPSFNFFSINYKACVIINNIRSMHYNKIFCCRHCPNVMVMVREGKKSNQNRENWRR
jgi:hypothetical protein